MSGSLGGTAESPRKSRCEDLSQRTPITSGKDYGTESQVRSFRRRTWTVSQTYSDVGDNCLLREPKTRVDTVESFKERLRRGGKGSETVVRSRGRGRRSDRGRKDEINRRVEKRREEKKKGKRRRRYRITEF